jgi:hypothetical protein
MDFLNSDTSEASADDFTFDSQFWNCTASAVGEALSEASNPDALIPVEIVCKCGSKNIKEQVCEDCGETIYEIVSSSASIQPKQVKNSGNIRVRTCLQNIKAKCLELKIDDDILHETCTLAVECSTNEGSIYRGTRKLAMIAIILHRLLEKRGIYRTEEDIGIMFGITNLSAGRGIVKNAILMGKLDFPQDHDPTFSWVYQITNILKVPSAYNVIICSFIERCFDLNFYLEVCPRPKTRVVGGMYIVNARYKLGLDNLTIYSALNITKITFERHINQLNKLLVYFEAEFKDIFVPVHVDT